MIPTMTIQIRQSNQDSDMPKLRLTNEQMQTLEVELEALFKKYGGFPQICGDNDGQLLVYTNLYEPED